MGVYVVVFHFFLFFDCFIVSTVYDITKRSSFLSIQRWIEEVRRYTTSDVILILIGNKCDLEEEREVYYRFNDFLANYPWQIEINKSLPVCLSPKVDLSEAQALCQYIPEISFVMETSAKENTNIKDIFYLLATELMVQFSYLKKKRSM